MKNILAKIGAALAAVILLATLIFTTGAGDYFGFSPKFGDSTGTNTMTWTDPGLAPYIAKGTNLYYAIPYTNFMVTNASGWFNMKVVNGVLCLP